MMFNIFINDIFKFVSKCDLANFADDNTVSYSHENADVWKETLEAEGESLVDWFAANGMQANPTKFQGIVFGKGGNEAKPTFQIKGEKVECTDSVKLLGVKFDEMLNFDEHVGDICKKAGRQINVLKRIGRNLNRACKKLIYLTFISSVFNFCPLVWHFCSKKNQDKLEKLNCRALRFVFDDHISSYEDLLKQCGSVTLHLRRRRLMALEVFKIIQGDRPAYMSNLVTVKPENKHYSFRYTRLVEPPDFKGKTYGKRCFKYEAALIWQKLPQHARDCTSFKDFKAVISTWDGDKCMCAMCK